MFKPSLLLMLPLVLLAACASKKGSIPLIVATSEQARAAVPFCDVAKPSWGEAVEGDPVRTKSQKAAFNGTGIFLECKGFKPK